MTALDAPPGRVYPIPMRWAAAGALILVLLAACGGGEPEALPPPAGGLEVTSPAFAEGEAVPAEFTCDGENVSPPLRWSGVPERAAELVLLVEDPDAPGDTFVHWVVFGLDPGLPGLERGTLPAGALEGGNDFGEVGYAGPCPPEGDAPHRYVFTLYAISEPLGLQEGASAEEVREAIAEITIAGGELTGTYGR